MTDPIINDLEQIKLDKDTNLKPENLKQGVNCLGIAGGLSFDKFGPDYDNCLSKAKQLEGTEPLQVDKLDNYFNYKNASSHGNSSFSLSYAIIKFPSDIYLQDSITSLWAMTSGLTYLTTIPNVHGKNIKFIYGYCDSNQILYVGSIDCGQVVRCSGEHSYSLYGNMSNMKGVRGLYDLGKSFSIDQPENYWGYQVDISGPWLDKKSYISTFNSIYNIKSIGVKPQKIIINQHRAQEVGLTDEEIAIATNKGWNVVLV